MKKVLNTVEKFLIGCMISAVVLMVALTAIAMKPTDQECIYALRGPGDGMAAVMQGIEVNSYTVTVEDHIFYKQVYSRFNGRELGVAFFGKVIKQ